MLWLRLPIPINRQHIVGHVDGDYHRHHSAVLSILLGCVLDPLAVEEGEEKGDEGGGRQRQGVVET